MMSIHDQIRFGEALAIKGLRNRRHYRAVAVILVSTLCTMPSYALNPNVAPGGNFDLSKFSLQLPTGSPGSPTTIPSSQLVGSNGYQDAGHKYFFTESGDGAMVMKVYGDPDTSGCVTTPNSTHCRTELRENGSWSPTAATNRMNATVVVTAASDNSVVIGQIHMDDSVSTKPVIELYYHSNGDIIAGVELNRDGSGGQAHTTVGHVPLGQQFSYEIEYSGGVLKVAINGTFHTISTNNLNNPSSYFKAGCYDQGTDLADVHFLALTIQH
jgi:Alginate lyase